ncbi:MAG TPA: phosphatase PAP2 family protein [Anaerolineaceae bacterium]
MKPKGLWLAVAVFVVFAIVFGTADWQISEALYNPQAGWALFMEAYGQLPAALLGFVSGSVLLRQHAWQKNFKSILAGVGIVLVTLVATFGFFADAAGAQTGNEDMNLALLAGLTLAALVVGQVLLRRMPREKLAPYHALAKIGLGMFFFAGLATVWLVKLPWGRWTYRDILEAGDPGLYTPWFLPQGPNGHHSFFSGHTAMCFLILPLMLLAKPGSPARRALLALVLMWGVAGAISRVMVGAHFASDVLFGAGETLLWFWILQKAYLPQAAQQPTPQTTPGQA